MSYITGKSRKCIDKLDGATAIGANLGLAKLPSSQSKFLAALNATLAKRGAQHGPFGRPRKAGHV